MHEVEAVSKVGWSVSCDGSARVLRVAVSSARFSTAERVRDAPLKQKFEEELQV